MDNNHTSVVITSKDPSSEMTVQVLSERLPGKIRLAPHDNITQCDVVHINGAQSDLKTGTMLLEQFRTTVASLNLAS